MATLTKSELPFLYDCAINGVGYLIAYEIDRELLSPWKSSYEVQEEDILIERRDTNISTDMSENKLDLLFWKSQRSWDYGAGQKRFDINIKDYPTERAFFDSQGVDVMSQVGQATLLPDVSRIVTLTNQGPVQPQRMVVTDQTVYVAAGQPNLKKFQSVTGSDATNISTATETSQDTYDLATDGGFVYVALGVDGTHRAGVAASTQREAFDATAGWSGTGNTFTADTSDKKEGTTSLKVTTDTTNPASKALGGGPLNFSAVDQFKIWVKPTADIWLRSTSSASSSSGPTSLTVPVPAGTAANDVLVAFVSGPGTITGPAGWTNYGPASFDSSTAMQVFVKIASSNEPASYDWTYSPHSDGPVATMLCYVGVDISGGQSALIDQITTNNGNSSTARALTVTTTASPEYLVCAYYTSTATTLSTPAGLTSEVSVTNVQSMRVCDKLLTTTGATGNFDSTLGVSAKWSTYTIVFKQASTGADVPSGTVKIRLQTSAGNYFERSLPALTGGTWYEDTSARTADWTSTGAPNWASVATILLVMSKPGDFRYDDFRSVVTGTFSHYSDADARVLGWAKDRLFGAGVQSGTQWQFFEVGSGATSTQRLLLPDGYTVTDISELGGFVYFTASRTTRSVIYAYDGSNTPFVALAMPPGEQAVFLQPFLGAGFLIGARRIGSSGSSSSGIGVLYRAFPQSTGHLTAERIETFGADDGRDYTPQAGTAYLDLAYFGRNFPDGTHTGLGVYNPATGGYARHVEASGFTGVVVDAGVFKNRRIFTIDGQGVFIEQSTYVASGTLTSSDLDWNIDQNKMILKGEIGTLALPASTSAVLSYSTDGGASFSTVTTENTTGATAATGPIRVSSVHAQYKATLATSNTAVTPTLKKAGLAAIYGVKPRRVFRLAIKAYARMDLKSGIPHPNSGPALPFTIQSRLEALRASQQIVQFQPPGWGEEETTDIPDVRVSSITLFGSRVPQVGYSNVLRVELTEVPS